MATWDKYNEESESDQDEEEANLGLVATTTSNAKYGSNYDDDDEVFSKLTHEEYVETAKELVGCCLNKSKALKTLQK